MGSPEKRSRPPRAAVSGVAEHVGGGRGVPGIDAGMAPCGRSARGAGSTCTISHFA